MAEISSFGTLLYVDATKTGSSFTRLADIEEGVLVEAMKDTYKAKVLDQATRAKEHRGTYFDFGGMTFKIVFDKTKYAAILGYVRDPDAYPVRIVLYDHATEGSRSKMQGSALFTKIGVPLEADGKRLVLDVTLTATGDWTFTPSS